MTFIIKELTIPLTGLHSINSRNNPNIIRLSLLITSFLKPLKSNARSEILHQSCKDVASTDCTIWVWYICLHSLFTLTYMCRLWRCLFDYNKQCKSLSVFNSQQDNSHLNQYTLCKYLKIRRNLTASKINNTIKFPLLRIVGVSAKLNLTMHRIFDFSD